MNKTFFYKSLVLFMAAVATVSFTSCGDDDDDTDNTISAYDSHAVDLGLPSGLKWSDQNLGANAPEGAGDHYAFGELTPKEDYSFDTYRFGDANALTKYVSQDQSGDYGKDGFFDNKTILDRSDDVASVKLKGKWRIPTVEEWNELNDNCTWTWTKKNGIDGYVVTGPSGNSIFLPVTGYRYGNVLHNETEYGTYWTATLGDGRSDYAQVFGIYASGHFVYRYLRDHGYIIRPVRE